MISPLPPLSRRRLRAALLAALVVSAAYLWTLCADHQALTSRLPSGYYGLLTDALVSGQLYFKAQPDPRLAQLANPYAGWQGVPMLHDASYYHGHYYLYFGVAPAALLLVPWRLATGTFLTEHAAIITFALIGFLLGTALWLRCLRHFFAGVGAGWIALGILLLGFGNYVFFLIQLDEFYEVPIACAYACLMALLLLVFRALEADSAVARRRLLAGASLAWGLSVGARPDYLFLAPVLAGPVLWLWREEGRRGGFGSPAAWRLAAAGLLPATVVGLALGWYNWARFGNPVEFGVHYQLAGGDQSHVALAALANIPSGVRAYLLIPVHYGLYFPFVTAGQTFGLLPWAPFATLAAAFPLTLLASARRRDPLWTVGAGAIAAAAVLNFSALCVYFFRQDRYAIDFLPAAILASLLVAGVMLGGAGALRRLGGPILAAAAFLTIGQCVFFGLGHRYAHGKLRPLARVFNSAAARVEAWLGVGFGPAELTLTLPPRPPAVGDEYLVATGGGRDCVYLREEADGKVRFGFYHTGAHGPISDPLAIDRGRSHRVEVDLGSLYPPADHPLFDGWAQDHVSALLRRVEVRLDGAPVLASASDFYPNDPLQTSFGEAKSLDCAAFQGRILNMRRTGLPSPRAIEPPAQLGPVRLTLRFPPFQGAHAEPLLSTGLPGAGDLVYVVYLSATRVRFGHDSWRSGGVDSLEAAFNPAGEQVVEIDLGSLEEAPEGPKPRPRPFTLRFNGRTLYARPRPFHRSPPIDVVFGFNATRSSTADPSFTGPELKAERLAPSALDPAAPLGNPFRLQLKFPAGASGGNEPLVCLGRTGAGDVIFVRYLDPDHVCLGYDHWGFPATIGAPLALDYTRPHEVSIALGPRLRADLDGRTALDAPAHPYPAAPEETAVGANPIGASSCSSVFSGAIYIAERAGPPAP